MKNCIIMLIILTTACSTVQINEMFIKKIEITIYWAGDYKKVFNDKAIIVLESPQDLGNIHSFIKFFNQNSKTSESYKCFLVEGFYIIKLFYNDGGIEEYKISNEYQIYDIQKKITYNNKVLINVLRHYAFLEIKQMINDNRINN